MKQNEKKIKKCSLCREPGHTKRDCVAGKAKEKNTSAKFVLVGVQQAHTRSPHVVDLKIKEENKIWNQVKVFSEKKVEPVKREVVDLAAVVRESNRGLRYTVRRLRPQIDANLWRKVSLSLISYLLSLIFRPRSFIIYHLSFIISSARHKFADFKNDLSGRVVETKQRALSIFTFRKFAYSFIALALLVVLPFPAIGYYSSVKDTSVRVVKASTNAFLSLQSSTVAALNANLGQAEYDLNAALQSFQTANSILDKEHEALQYVAGMLPVIGRQVKSRQSLLVAGHHLALGNTYLVKGIEEANKQEAMPVSDKIGLVANYLRSAAPQYEEALTELSEVSAETVPVEYQESFVDFKLLFAAFVDDMRDLIGLSDALQIAFGHEQPRRYLLIFQNNDELRPTGGFMGSFAVLDVQKGKIMNLDIPGGGTYDLQGQLDAYLKPPLPLQLGNKRWEFQDANWFPDFPTAAKKIAWFYEHGRGATVDGVIAINATVLERLLSVLGPVQSSDKNLVIASSDAVEKLQQEIEFDYDKNANKPKEILGELAPRILAGLGGLDTVSMMRLVSELEDALQKREIQLYFTDELAQDKMLDFGWAGEIRQTAGGQDYLGVINTNIQGQKSDAKIKQTIEHQSVVQDDGSVIDTVIITRKHTGVAGVALYGANNVDYLRVYVPAGSELLEAGGFTFPPEDAFKVPENWYTNDKDLATQEKEVGIHPQSGTRITKEFNKTAFGNWVMVAPGETTSAYFTYRLPFKASARYSLLTQKQSGIDSDFTTQVIYPAGWSPVWSADDETQLASNGAAYSGVLDEDRVVGVVMQQ